MNTTAISLLPTPVTYTRRQIAQRVIHHFITLAKPFGVGDNGRCSYTCGCAFAILFRKADAATFSNYAASDVCGDFSGITKVIHPDDQAFCDCMQALHDNVSRHTADIASARGALLAGLKAALACLPVTDADIADPCGLQVVPYEW